MSSRNEILASIRGRRIDPSPLPELRGDWIQYRDPLTQFQSLVEAVGGQCVQLANVSEIANYLAGMPQFAAATKIISVVAEVPATVDIATIDDPHDLETIDWAILPAQFGVAENGAVWVTDQHVGGQRAIYFIVQHLALVMPASQIVHNLHEAYERITPGMSSLGLLMSGPSKTADIEQSLVIGAHGPRSLTIFLIGPSQPNVAPPAAGDNQRPATQSPGEAAARGETSPLA